MTLAEIYNEFPLGSDTFVRAIQSHCGFNCSNVEIEILAEISATAEEFEFNWENTAGWADPDR